MASRRVYIAAEVTRRADIYHPHRECHSIEWSEVTEIAESTAKRHGLSECDYCSGARTGGPMRKLIEMSPDDLPHSGGEA